LGVSALTCFLLLCQSFINTFQKRKEKGKKEKRKLSRHSGGGKMQGLRRHEATCLGLAF
jgi:hypothetical protein